MLDSIYSNKYYISFIMIILSLIYYCNQSFGLLDELVEMIVKVICIKTLLKCWYLVIIYLLTTLLNIKVIFIILIFWENVNYCCNY